MTKRKQHKKDDILGAVERLTTDIQDIKSANPRSGSDLQVLLNYITDIIPKVSQEDIEQEKQKQVDEEQLKKDREFYANLILERPRHEDLFDKPLPMVCGLLEAEEMKRKMSYGQIQVMKNLLDQDELFKLIITKLHHDYPA